MEIHSTNGLWKNNAFGFMILFIFFFVFPFRVRRFEGRRIFRNFRHVRRRIQNVHFFEKNRFEYCGRLKRAFGKVPVFLKSLNVERDVRKRYELVKATTKTNRFSLKRALPAFRRKRKNEKIFMEKIVLVMCCLLVYHATFVFLVRFNESLKKTHTHKPF